MLSARQRLQLQRAMWKPESKVTSWACCDCGLKSADLRALQHGRLSVSSLLDFLFLWRKRAAALSLTSPPEAWWLWLLQADGVPWFRPAGGRLRPLVAHASPPMHSLSTPSAFNLPSYVFSTSLLGIYSIHKLFNSQSNISCTLTSFFIGAT